MSGGSRAEQELVLMLRAHAQEAETKKEAQFLKSYTREYRFNQQRRWRFDFAWIDHKIAIEVEGVVGGAGGRHQRAGGFSNDCEKYNSAIIDGWRILRYTQKQIAQMCAINDLKQIWRNQQ